MTRKVYADHAATTPMSKVALTAMIDFLSTNYGNPSGVHSVSQEARKILDESRERIAKAIGANKTEVYFTSNGSESDNWAIKGVAELKKNEGRHIITSTIEHHAVLYSCQHLENNGYEVTYLEVDEYGTVSPDDLRSAIRDDTILVSIMMANNEIGTILPIKELVAVAKEHAVLFHTDAVQTIGHIPVDVNELGVDLLTFAGHKFGGPKGIGGLYIRRPLRLPPMIHGGGQEKGIRGGTENVAAIVGMAAAIEDSVSRIPESMPRLSMMRDRLIEETMKIGNTRLTGHPTNRLPGNASFTFEGIEGESAVLTLDYRGIQASTGSACSTGSLDPSHVLMAIGLPHVIGHGSVRFSLGDDNTEEDIDYLIEQIPAVVERLRSLSPLCDCGEKKV